MAFNCKGIGNWIQKKILEPIDDILKGEVGRMKEDEELAKKRIADEKKRAENKDTEAKNGVQVAGIPKFLIPLGIASVVIYFLMKK